MTIRQVKGIILLATGIAFLANKAIGLALICLFVLICVVQTIFEIRLLVRK